MTFRLRPFLLLAGVVLLAGCATIEDRTPFQLPAAVSQTNYYARAKPQVFETLLTVLEEMDYTVSRALPAQGVIEVYGHLLEGDAPGTSRQYYISARLREVGVDETSVELTVQEAQEGTFSAGATRRTHAQHGRYDSIYEALEKALGEGSWLPPSQPVAGPGQSAR